MSSTILALVAIGILWVVGAIAIAEPRKGNAQAEWLAKEMSNIDIYIKNIAAAKLSLHDS
ncbi:MAG: hypothetical protein E6Q77_10115 [Rhizobium sp.]|nr:MAG: hypothetical protein E6Q77_10115 [Rhizobium sp.]